jgi:hypothetical protein
LYQHDHYQSASPFFTLEDHIFDINLMSISLSTQDKELLNRISHVQTNIGTVAVLGFSEDIPQGWERLRK